jgi:hypothetical protein
MTFPPPRTTEQRKVDTLAKLREPALDGWVASAGAHTGAQTGAGAQGQTAAETGARTTTGGGAHLVPVSLYWTGDRIIIAVAESSLTARNIIGSGTARIGLGPTRDVVMIDASLDLVIRVPDAPAAIADGYAGQADWDPRTAGPGYVYIVLRPERIQAWREVDEMTGRTLFKAGAWVV